MSGKIFVIGIDGGEFSLIKKWVKQGKLPNMQKIMEKGSFGNLKSTIPPITGAAWSSFQTGTNPGKHGAFNWFKRLKDEYRAAPVNANDIGQPTIWQILSKLKKKVGVIGVPVTYPPRPVDGFVIPGLLTPYKSEQQSYPSSLIKEIEELVPDFKFSPKEWTRGYKPEDWVEELVEDVGNRVKLTIKMMRNKVWDVMMVHFMETDQVQHFMWHFQKEGNWDPILQVYEKVDQAIGQMQQELDDDDTLFIMSDHGFGELNYNFHIDTWLLEEGYITLKKNIWTRLKKLAFKLGITKETLYPIGEYIYPRLRKAGLLETALELASHPWLEWLFLSSQNVDWPQTRAYSHSEIGHIYLNVKGREPQGAVEPEDIPVVRDEIIEKLQNLKNPFNGKKMIGEIYKGEELYHGDRVKSAPDIVFLPEDMELLGKGAYEFLSHKVVSKSRSHSGHHRLDGIFLAQGPHIKSENEIATPHIMDIVPTLLYQMDLPLLEHMDGQVIEDIYNQELLGERKQECVTKADLQIDTDDGEDGEMESDEELKRRLKGLGYVS